MSLAAQSLKPDVGSRYRVLELIGKGGMGKVYRALDLLSGQHVALKRVAATLEEDTQRSASSQKVLGRGAIAVSGQAVRAGAAPAFAATMFEHSTANTLLAHGTAATLANTAPARTRNPDQLARDLAFRLALEQEFRTLASLRHPHIISVLDYGFDLERTPFFTMELLDAAVPLLDAARGRSVEQKVALLMQIAQALSYLHRNAVLHRDLKPAKPALDEKWHSFFPATAAAAGNFRAPQPSACTKACCPV